VSALEDLRATLRDGRAYESRCLSARLGIPKAQVAAYVNRLISEHGCGIDNLTHPPAAAVYKMWWDPAADLPERVCAKPGCETMLARNHVGAYCHACQSRINECGPDCVLCAVGGVQ
jgi:hypothetical protein